jgi:DNA-binding beta-propeller fold protein YncE
MSINVVQTDLTNGTAKTFTAEDLAMPHGVALTVDNSKLVVSSSMGDVLYIVDAESMAMTGMIMLMDGGMDNMHMPTGVAVVQE